MPHQSEVLAALERILASPTFSQAERQSRFLRYVVERTLAGAPLKESLIGVEVYGRSSDYDPKADSIVRVEAGRLRNRLEEYYHGLGKDDPVVIALPKGGYMCEFARRAGDPSSAVQSPRRIPRKWWVAAGAVAVFVLFAVLWTRTDGKVGKVVEAPLPDFLEAHRLLRPVKAGSGESHQQNIERAIVLFEKSAQTQPNSAVIYAGLAQAYLGLADYVDGKFVELHLKAQEYAEHALKLDDSLDEAHNSLGAALFFARWDLNGALAEFTRALQLNPRRAHTHRLRSDVLCILGRFDEAVAALSAAQTLEPTDVELGAQKAAVLYRWRKFDLALAEARRALAIEPDNSYALWVVGLINEQQGRIEEAEAQFRKLEFRPVRAPLALAHLLASQGKKREAFTLASEVERQVHTPAGQAVVYAGAGDRQAAIDSLQRAYRERDLDLLYTVFDPRLDALRGEAQFRDLMNRLGIAGKDR